MSAEPYFKPVFGWIDTPAGPISLKDSDALMDTFDDEMRAALKAGDSGALERVGRIGIDLIKARTACRRWFKDRMGIDPCARSPQSP